MGICILTATSTAALTAIAGCTAITSILSDCGTCALVKGRVKRYFLIHKSFYCFMRMEHGVLMGWTQ